MKFTMKLEEVEMQLCPMMGHKKVIPSHYLDYIFHSRDYKGDDSLGHLWELPSLPNEEFAVHLCFTASGELSIKSLLRDKSFLLNGNKVFIAELKMNDQVVIGHNVIKFVPVANGTLNQAPQNTEFQEVAEQFWNSPLNLLIEGETGVGKTRLAKWFYDQNTYTKKWCHVNLASFAPSLIESELFGHVKGAFTGAINDKKGALEDAHQGLLFLDEVDSLTTEMQVKLLLFLDDQTLRPVGSTVSKKIKSKIIFASGRPLLSLVEQGLIRKDFYYRMASGLKIQLPSLKEDKKLIENFVNDFCHEKMITISPQLLEFYRNFSWPGNFRQLKDHLIKKSISSKKMRMEFDLHDEGLLLGGTNKSPLNSLLDGSHQFLSLEDVKQLYTQKIFQVSEGDWQQTADVLGISKKTVRSMLLGNAS
jgi:DNA-binding NtrC family response regulator